MISKAASNTPDRPVYEEYKAEIGEDPARVLYSGMDPRPRIRGIQSIEVIRAYLDVETDRSKPRRKVIAALNDRQQQLEAAADQGGRDD